MELPKKVLDILVCPICKGDLKQNKNKLICTKCKKIYFIKDNIPILLPNARVA